MRLNQIFDALIRTKPKPSMAQSLIAQAHLLLAGSGAGYSFIPYGGSSIQLREASFGDFRISNTVQQMWCGGEHKGAFTSLQVSDGARVILRAYGHNVSEEGQGYTVQTVGRGLLWPRRLKALTA